MPEESDALSVGPFRMRVEVITFENAYRPLGWRKDGAWLRSEGLAWGTRGRAEGDIAVRVAGDRGAGTFECTATMADSPAVAGRGL